MQKITPCLWFEERCEEGINFYINVFNSSPEKTNDSKIISINRYPDHFKGAPWPASMDGKVLTAIFELSGARFMALDGGPGVFPKSGPVSFEVECESQEAVDHFWSKLTEGGNPEAQQCGWLQDKYGFSWQIIPKILGELLSGPDKERADRVMKAMLQMKKIDIEVLKHA